MKRKRENENENKDKNNLNFPPKILEKELKDANIADEITPSATVYLSGV